MNQRKNNKKKVIHIGEVSIGGDYPIAIQSMTNTKTEDVASTVAQIHALSAQGCEMIRVAVPTLEAAHALRDIKKQIRIPLIADIHFDYRLALASMEAGVDKIRINPGNIGSPDRVREVAKAAAFYGVPIRVGANSGSVKKSLVKEKGMVDALVESVLEQVEVLQSYDFYEIVVAIKSSDVWTTVEACEKINTLLDYPQHIGITESGSLYDGIVKSSVGMGALLTRGIGSTMRVSLTADPVEEIKCAKAILKQLGMRSFGPRIISCPTCGRTRVNVMDMVEKVVQDTASIQSDIKIAVMGCEVNGPGEARDADIGIAGGDNCYLLFKGDQLVGRYNTEEAYNKLMEEIIKMDKNRSN